MAWGSDVDGDLEARACIGDVFGPRASYTTAGVGTKPSNARVGLAAQRAGLDPRSLYARPSQLGLREGEFRTPAS